MEREVLIELGNYLAEHIEFIPPARIEGCDNTLRMTMQWLYAHGRPVEDDLAWLANRGGYCDCEVLLNAMPDDSDEWVEVLDGDEGEEDGLEEGDGEDDEPNVYLN